MSKKLPVDDPNAQAEAQKYENPIPSREFIMQVLEQQGKPLRREALAEHLGLFEEQDLIALHRRLRAMERDGQVIFNRRREYGLASKMDLVSGRVIGHPNGFGFVVPDRGGEDLFLAEREMRALMHGDRVVVREIGTDRRGRLEGVLVDVLERNTTQVVGRLFIEGGVGFLIADNKRIAQDILIPREAMQGAKHGQIVCVDITEQPSRIRQAVGKVIEILGEHMAPGMEIDIAIRSHNLPQMWPPDVEAQARHFSEEVPESAKQGREDLRDIPLLTIDGADARDFDDAVFCEPKGKGWRLIVAIADVSAYVDIDTALDREARERGNSVYFPERVIPMLPEVLSNGLCSLNPEVDRLCMACEMTVSPSGQLKKYRFFKAVMRSHARLTYSKVAAMLVDKDKQLCEQYAALLTPLENLYSLFKTMLRTREKRGAIEFETTETRIVFGEARKIERIIPVQRNDAHRLIEECMLLANLAAADFLLQHEIPILYRNHAAPGQEKLTGLREFLGEIGLTLAGGDEPEPKHYAKLINTIRGRHDAHLIQTVLLRSLKQAVYAAENIGHFGLAYAAYTHFTSPIRRYPDLLVHRAIKHLIAAKPVKEFHYSSEAMLQLGEHCSMTERRADEATRDAIDWLKCEYMMDKLGEEYDGIINTVTNFGVFVELDEIFVEGLIHITELDKDYYHFDATHHRLIGERSGHTYRLGDPIRIVVSRVDLDEKKIDFELAETQPQLKKAHKAKPNKGKSAGKGKAKKADKQAGKNKTSSRKSNNKAGKNKPAKKKAAKKKSVRKKAAKKKNTKKKAVKKKVTKKKTTKKKASAKSSRGRR